ncbi:hypothetical protein BBK36DRAFT_168915, partial [Trichoderma citrinoviride]
KDSPPFLRRGWYGWVGWTLVDMSLDGISGAWAIISSLFLTLHHRLPCSSC